MIEAKVIGHDGNTFYFDRMIDSEGSPIINSKGKLCGLTNGPDSAVTMSTVKWMIKNAKDYPKRDIKMTLSTVSLKEISHVNTKNYREHLKVTKNAKDPLKIGDIIHLKDRWNNILWTYREEKLTLDVTRDGKIINIEFYF